MKNLVKYLRRSQGFDMTQGELAAIIGVSTATVSAIENGANTSGKIMLKISEVFNKDPREIFFVDDVSRIDNGGVENVATNQKVVKVNG